MQVVKRRQHYTDYVPDVNKPNNKKRAIKNWCNFKDHLGNWAESSPAVASQLTAPPEFSGTYDFDRASLNAPLQFFARDAMDAGNRAMVGIRLSDSPSKWINIKASNIDSAIDVTEIDSNTVQWTGLWTDTNYRVQHNENRIKIDFVLTGENHPASFQETIKLAPSLSLVDNGNNTLSVMDGETEVFKMPAPYGYAESDTALENPIRVTMVKGEKQGVFETVIITPNADDLASVGYAENIIIDPTTDITGTDNIDDCFIRDSTPDSNLGGISIRIGDASSVLNVGLIKIATNSIPADATYNTFTMTVGSINSSNTATISFYKVTDGRTWGETTATWNNYDGTNPWTSGGVMSSGNDYVADASPPQQTWSGQETQTVTLKTSWLSDWKTGVNNGIVMHNPSTWQDLRSSENANEARVYFTIDYTEGADENATLFATNF